MKIPVLKIPVLRVTALAVLVSAANTNTAHAAPALTFGCDYGSASQYGGYGWRAISSESCDPIINQQTGSPVELTRVAWDGNADLANRTIQCDLYSFDTTQQNYQLDQGPGRHTDERSFRFEYLPLSPIAPFTGWVNTWRTADSSLALIANERYEWKIENGSYVAGREANNALVKGTLLEYPDLELVTRGDGSKAVRRWVSSSFSPWSRLGRNDNVGVDRSGYFECRDISGADLVPTGTAGTPTREPASLSDLEFSVAANPAFGQPGEVFNLETGEAVNLTKAYWNYNRDIAGSYSCRVVQFDSGRYVPDTTFSATFTHPHHFTNSSNTVHYRAKGPFEWAYWKGRYDVRNNVAAPVAGDGGNVSHFQGDLITGSALFASEFVELTGNGVNVWYSSEHYEECFGATPTGTAPGGVTPTPACDYSNADSNGGWGWNPVTRESCAPANNGGGNGGGQSSSCDYSSAAINGGWGWNSTSNSSCPPQTTTPDACDYSNAAINDGWGWNATTGTSCQPR